jgi:transcriptional regulator with XRE-family HTH domain
MPRLSEQARERIRDEMQRRQWSQRDLADLLQWSQSKIAKVLNGRVALTVDDLDAIAVRLTLRPAELIRDRGLEFYREMTPSDLRLFQMLDDRPDLRTHILGMLQVLREVEPRRASRPRKKRAAKAKL